MKGAVNEQMVESIRRQRQNDYAQIPYGRHQAIAGVYSFAYCLLFLDVCCFCLFFFLFIFSLFGAHLKWDEWTESYRSNSIGIFKYYVYVTFRCILRLLLLNSSFYRLLFLSVVSIVFLPKTTTHIEIDCSQCIEPKVTNFWQNSLPRIMRLAKYFFKQIKNYSIRKIPKIQSKL